jgi:5'-3' exonuclease
MGIPYLFQNIVKSNPHLIKEALVSSENVTRLFLDFNSIIHTCSNKVASSQWPDIFKAIVDHTMIEVVDRCMPSELLFISIDGVAPLAKIQQQRKRRYMTSYRNEKIREWKIQRNIGIRDWDSNIITPGTEFMKRLDQYLEAHFTKSSYPFKVIVSGSSARGEGEQKIINYIKNRKNENGVDVIYGLDADLIMLCLTCNQPNIFLMREDETSTKFLTIDGLRTSVASHLATDTSIKFMRDYVALCIFLGNDFLPCLPFLKLKHKGLQTLIDAYKKTFVEVKDNLIIGKHSSFIINKKFLLKLLENLVAVEDAEMLRIHTHWVNARPFTSKHPDTELDAFINSLEDYPSTHPRKYQLAKLLRMPNPKWRTLYYDAIFQNHDATFVTNLVMRYLKGLDWIVDYYMNQCSDNTWMYEYGYAPSVSDLHTCLYTQTCHSKDPPALLGEQVPPNITESMQLLMVIPPKSFGVLPPEVLAKTSSSRIAHMFPMTYNIEMYLKTYLWECVPILPSINIKEIAKVVQ